MATFGRRLSALRARAAAVPPGTVTTRGTESRIGNIFARGAIGIAQRAAQVARQQVGLPARPIVSQVPRVTPSPRQLQTDPLYNCPSGHYIVGAGTRSKKCVPLPCPPGQEMYMGVRGPPMCRRSTKAAIFVRPTSVMTAGGKGAKVPFMVANGIKEIEALPSQPGIGPAREGDSFWRQLVTTGLEKVLGPATTPTRPSPQPGVTEYDDDFAMAAPAGGMPGWLIPAALIGGFLLLRR